MHDTTTPSASERANSEPPHIPGDTNTAPAPDAVWIGSGDA